MIKKFLILLVISLVVAGCTAGAATPFDTSISDQAPNAVQENNSDDSTPEAPQPEDSPRFWGWRGRGMRNGHGMHWDGHHGMMRWSSQDAPPEVAPLPTVTPGGEASVSYRKEIQPILDRYCVQCHGGVEGLWMDRFENLMRGGEHGSIISPGNPEDSELYLRLTGSKLPAMPLGSGPLSSRQVELIRLWIEDGAPNN
jgi:hypothetical protein